MIALLEFPRDVAIRRMRPALLAESLPVGGFSVVDIQGRSDAQEVSHRYQVTFERPRVLDERRRRSNRCPTDLRGRGGEQRRPFPRRCGEPSHVHGGVAKSWSVLYGIDERRTSAAGRRCSVVNAQLCACSSQKTEMMSVTEILRQLCLPFLEARSRLP